MIKHDIINNKEYEFLKTNPLLQDNIILLCFGGSHAYGLSTPESDVDIRGITLENLSSLIGLNKFEQFENKQTDTVIYGLRKIIFLLINCNPNVIELLGQSKDNYIILSEKGELLRDNIDLFLSQRAYKSFGGYAISQLRRIENALARDNVSQDKKEEHMLNSIYRSMDHIKRSYAPFSEKDVKLYIAESDKDDLDSEIYIDINLERYPLRDFKNVLQTMTNIIRGYDKIGTRNKKKDTASLYKHAMHLIRLLLMGTEILKGKGVNTKRTDPLENSMLMSIRNGEVSFEYVFSLVEKINKDFEEAYKATKLPKSPDLKKIENLMIDLFEDRLIRM